IGRNEEIPVGGGARFGGLEVQTAESNANALNLMAFSKVPDITAEVEKANGAIGLELKKRYDNNNSNLLRRSHQWPFLQRGVPAKKAAATQPSSSAVCDCAAFSVAAARVAGRSHAPVSACSACSACSVVARRGQRRQRDSRRSSMRIALAAAFVMVVASAAE